MHVDFDTDIVGKGRVGLRGAFKGTTTTTYLDGAQYVVLTKVILEETQMLVYTDDGPYHEVMEDTVGYNIKWYVTYLQGVLALPHKM